MTASDIGWNIGKPYDDGYPGYRYFNYSMGGIAYGKKDDKKTRSTINDWSSGGMIPDHFDPASDWYKNYRAPKPQSSSNSGTDPAPSIPENPPAFIPPLIPIPELVPL